MKSQLTSQDWQLLSAYLDGELSPRELTLVEQNLQTRPDYQQALQEMRRNRAMLHSLPRRRVPHNFTLTPEMVGKPRRSWFNIPQLVPALRFSSALATLLVIITLVADLIPGGRAALQASQPSESAATVASSERAMGVMQENAPKAAGDAQSSPPMVYWGGPPPDTSGAYGMGGGGDGSVGGLGGGGGTTTEQLPNVFHQPNEVPPSQQNTAPQTIAPAPQIESQPQQPESQPQMGVASSAPAITGTGPILGVQADEAGKVLSETTVDDTLVKQQEAESARQMNWRVAQIGLAVLAVITGLAAFFLRRTVRR